MSRQAARDKVTANAVAALLDFGLTRPQIAAALRLADPSVRKALRMHGDQALLNRYLGKCPEVDIARVHALARQMLERLPKEDPEVVQQRRAAMNAELSGVAGDEPARRAIRGAGGVVRWVAA